MENGGFPIEMLDDNWDSFRELAPLLKSKRMLYVEDNLMTRNMMRLAMEGYFQEFHDAADGKEGLDLFRKNKYDLVITDLNMPVMNGLEMSRQIHAADRMVPIIVITSYSDLEIVHEASQAGIIHYLLKPFHTIDLFDAIIKCLKLG